MTKRNAARALLFTTLFLVAPGAMARAQPDTQQVKETLANTAIDRARFQISIKNFVEAQEVLNEVLSDKSLSDETTGRALLQKGNLGMHTSDFTGAKRDYQSVLDLAGISAKLRSAAKAGFEFADSFEKLRRK
jgi:hypothetical protein